MTITLLVWGLVAALLGQNIAPAIEWQKCFGGSENENLYSIIPTPDGGYIFASASFSNNGDLTGIGGRGSFDIWVVKLSSVGLIEWQKRLGGSATEVASSISTTRDGGYILTGWTGSNDFDVSGNHGGADIWVVKLSSTGAIQWQRCLGGSGFDFSSALVETLSDGFLLLGTTRSNDGDVSGNHSNAQDDGWLVKLSSAGTIEWQKCLGGSLGEAMYSLTLTNDGGCIVAGSTYSSDGDVIGQHGGNDMWVVKLNDLGTIQWKKCLGGSNEEVAFSIIKTLDGGYAVAGSTGSNNGDVSGNHGGSDAWVVKLSPSGSIQWQKCLGGSASEDINMIIQTREGDYVLGGSTSSNDGDVTNNQGGYGDAWIVKLTNQGVIQWQKAVGGTDPEKFTSIIALRDGNYLASGYTISTNIDVAGNHGASDVWIVKLSPAIKAIAGSIQQSNTFCQALSPPQYLANIQVKMEKNSTAYYTSTDALGHFAALIDTGRFNVSTVPPNQLWTACPIQTVTLSNPNIKDTMTVNSNLYVNAICPFMEIQLTTPFLRRCFESPYVINYANRGTAVQNDATAELTLDSALTYVSATRPVRSRVGNKITFSLGNVGINQMGQFTVNVMVSCNSVLGQAHCSSVLIPKTMTCDTVQDSIPTIINQCVAGCDTVSFWVSKPNTTLNKTFKYQLLADANLIDTGRFTLINTFNLKRKRDGRTYRLEIRNLVTNQLLAARSAESSPTVSTPSVSTGFVNQFSQSIKQANISENCTANRGAFDPNDKGAVPTGIGARHFIEQGNAIDYLVQFQNTGTDTAFKVVVRDTLATHFDWSTFKLNAQSHTATWQLNPQGVLIVTFNNINLVDSFTNERGSHGFFKYSIKLKDSIVTNTIVTNKAAIYFDFNAPIITNLTTHTIGKEGLKSCLKLHRRSNK